LKEKEKKKERKILSLAPKKTNLKERKNGGGERKFPARLLAQGGKEREKGLLLLAGRKKRDGAKGRGTERISF